MLEPDWDAILPITRVAAIGQQGGSYVLHLVNPYWQRTHAPTIRHPLPPERVILTQYHDLQFVTAKREAITAVLAPILTHHIYD